MDFASAVPAFILVMLLGSMSPGPDFAVVVQRSAVSGRRSGLFAALGVGAGVTVWMVAAATGVAALLAASATVFTVVKIVGAGYLVFLGVRALLAALRRGERDMVETVRRRPVSAGRAFRQGLLCNVLNPKAGVFFVALIPQFLPAHSSLAQTAVLVAAGVLVNLSWFLLIAVVVGTASRIFARAVARRVLHAITGTALIAMGARVAAG